MSTGIEPSTSDEVATILQRLAELTPLFAANAEATETLREPVLENIEALEESGFFRLCWPKRFGGLEPSMVDQNRATAHVARGCPSTSWVASIYIGVTWFVGCCDDRFQDEFFASADVPRATAVAAPSGRARRVGGGLVVNGTWAFNTGNAHAQWAFLALLVEEEDGSLSPMFAAIPSADIEPHDDWHAFGMAGSGSNSVTVTDAFVPEHRLCGLQRALTCDYRSEREAANPYFNVPFVPRFITSSIGTPLGIAEGAYDAFMKRLPGRAITYSAYPSQAEAPITHHQVAEAAMKIESVRHHGDVACRMLDDWVAQERGIKDRFKARAHIGYGTRLAEEAVRILYQASGASAIQHRPWSGSSPRRPSCSSRPPEAEIHEHRARA
jgi:alkylation response protein AidB-like acyl-CoA dehydrogenase